MLLALFQLHLPIALLLYSEGGNLAFTDGNLDTLKNVTQKTYFLGFEKKI